MASPVAVVGLGYLVAGYVVTGVGLGVYVGSLLVRARRARARAAALAGRSESRSVPGPSAARAAGPSRGPRSTPPR